jgi:hypothetical protein
LRRSARPPLAVWPISARFARFAQERALEVRAFAYRFRLGKIVEQYLSEITEAYAAAQQQLVAFQDGVGSARITSFRVEKPPSLQDENWEVHALLGRRAVELILIIDEESRHLARFDSEISRDSVRTDAHFEAGTLRRIGQAAAPASYQREDAIVDYVSVLDRLNGALIGLKDELAMTRAGLTWRKPPQWLRREAKSKRPAADFRCAPAQPTSGRCGIWQFGKVDDRQRRALRQGYTAACHSLETIIMRSTAAKHQAQISRSATSFVVGAIAAVALTLAPDSVYPQGAVELVVVDVHAVAAGHSVKKLTGSAVTNDQNEKIGTLEDIIVNKDRALFAVLQVGGFLHLGGHLVVVPYESLAIDDAGHKVVLHGATVDALRKLPEFKYGA